MVTQTGSSGGVASVTLHLQFTRGRHGAGARLDVLERPAGRVGLLSLRGWVDLSAQRGIEGMLDDVAAREVSRLVVDCSQLLHIDYRLVPRLADSLLRFESHVAPVGLCGLSRYLRDLFRIAGCDSRLACWPTVADLLEAPVGAPGRERERAS
jgi:anti-anti-sigma regulatory factor